MIMRIVMYHSENSGIGYWRVWNPAKCLRGAGHEVWKFPHDMKGGVPVLKKDERDDKIPEGQWINSRIGSFERHGEWGDIFIFQRPLQPINIAVQAALRKTYNKPIVAEIDDDITSVHPSSPAYKYYRKYDSQDIYETIIIPLEDWWKFKDEKKFTKRIVEQKVNLQEKKMRIVLLKEGMADCHQVGLDWLKVADAVTVSTQALKELFSKYNKNIYVLPNSIDFQLNETLEKEYRAERPKKEKRDKDEIMIGWAGGYTHADDVALIAPAMGIILKKYPNVKFQWTAFKSMELLYLTKEFPGRVIPIMGVPINRWVHNFIRQELDIGLAPLVDSQFNRGKSNLKFLEHSALKIPMVLSPVRPYLETVKDGETGFFAKTTEDWVKKISLLVESEELRTRMGNEAYCDVKRNFNIRDNIYLWEKAYTEIIERFNRESKQDVSPLLMADNVRNESFSQAYR